jgi:mRNA deadenylase 3'-5' endonuclease subunit Ccr4
MNKIIIITYNILSPNLAKLMINNLAYTIEIMDDNNRLMRVLEYINSWIKLYSKYSLIICLQEVCEEWLINLSKLFNENNFAYLNIQHGRVDNGNMGVLIAYPNRLLVLKSDFYCVGQHIPVTDENSRKASIKTNTAIMALFEDQQTKSKFGIITYHMPCVPLIQEIGLLHCQTLYRHIKKFMLGDYWVLAGDFNMMHDSLAYKYMIEKAKLGCIWKDTIGTYPITNHAIIATKEFEGCIDYVFYRKGCYSRKNSSTIIFKRKGLICDKIKLNSLTAIIPNKYEPSDHIPIISEFLII